MFPWKNSTGEKDLQQKVYELEGKLQKISEENELVSELAKPLWIAVVHLYDGTKYKTDPFLPTLVETISFQHTKYQFRNRRHLFTSEKHARQFADESMSILDTVQVKNLYIRRGNISHIEVVEMKSQKQKG